VDDEGSRLEHGRYVVLPVRLLLVGFGILLVGQITSTIFILFFIHVGILQISGLLRTNLRFCREWHSRQRFAIACFCRALDDKNLKFTPEKPLNRAPISRFSSQLTTNLYHSKCLNPWYEPTEESRGSLLKPILGA
jgi:hypothetical protein